MPLKYAIILPVFKDLNINREQAVMVGARAGATYVRKRLRAGVDGNYNGIPDAKDSARVKPMRRTGDLLNSIKAGRLRGLKRIATISPRGVDRKGVPNATKVAVALLKRNVKLMLVDATLAKIIRQAINKNIEKALKKKGFIMAGIHIIRSK